MLLVSTVQQYRLHCFCVMSKVVYELASASMLQQDKQQMVHLADECVR